MDFNLKPTYVNFKKIFLLADTHFGVRTNSREWLTNQEEFFYNFYIPHLKSNKEEGSILFILGDLFDSRQSLDVYVLNSAIKIVNELSNILPVHMILGNHDCALKTRNDINSLVIFRNNPNIYIYEEPIIITNNTSNILLLPWNNDKEIEKNYIKHNSNSASYIFAHTDMTGFIYDTGKNIEKGISANNIKGYKKIFSGHIHKRQETNKMLYIGSPYHTKRGDIGNKKYLYTFEPDKNKLDYVENKNSPIFQKIHLETLMEWTLSFVYNVLKNNYTDIIVPDKYIHLFNLTKFIELLANCPYKKITAVSEKVKIEEDVIGIVDGENIKDILTLIEINMDDLGLPGEILGKLKELNKKYYEKALNGGLED